MFTQKPAPQVQRSVRVQLPRIIKNFCAYVTRKVLFLHMRHHVVLIILFVRKPSVTLITLPGVQIVNCFHVFDEMPRCVEDLSAAGFFGRAEKDRFVAARLFSVVDLVEVVGVLLRGVEADAAGVAGPQQLINQYILIVICYFRRSEIHQTV